MMYTHNNSHDDLVPLVARVVLEYNGLNVLCGKKIMFDTLPFGVVMSVAQLLVIYKGIGELWYLYKGWSGNMLNTTFSKSL